MGWMEERAGQRAIRRGCGLKRKSVIALAMSYAPEQRSARAGRRDRAGPEFSVYAQGAGLSQDGEKGAEGARPLHRRHGASELKVFVDTAPVMEKPLSARRPGSAGRASTPTSSVAQPRQLAVPRRHLHRGWSWSPTRRPRDHCGSLQRLPRRLPDRRDRRPPANGCAEVHFLSHHRASRPDPARISRGDGQPHLRLRRLSRRLPVEPLRRAAQANRAFLPAAELAAPALADLLTLDDASFREMFSGAPIKRIGVKRFLRNCLIAAGNSGDRRWSVGSKPARRRGSGGGGSGRVGGARLASGEARHASARPRPSRPFQAAAHRHAATVAMPDPFTGG